MANALQEQLLKAGLASKQKVRDVKTFQNAVIKITNR